MLVAKKTHIEIIAKGRVYLVRVLVPKTGGIGAEVLVPRMTLMEIIEFIWIGCSARQKKP